MINVETDRNMDKITIVVEMNNYIEFYTQEYLIKLKKNIIDRLYRELQIHCLLELVNPETLKRSEGKAKRVFYNRELSIILKNKIAVKKYYNSFLLLFYC